jgi:hypothetical protein
MPTLEITHSGFGAHTLRFGRRSIAISFTSPNRAHPFGFYKRTTRDRNHIDIRVLGMTLHYYCRAPWCT